MMSSAPAQASVQERKATPETRFAFGKNWQRFLQVLNDDRIAEAEKSLRSMLEVDDLRGKSFLDIGQELKRRYFPDTNNWSIEQGSVLDQPYLASLGQFDVVYSWGVLHHTGIMWQALENAVLPVAARGKLFIALYNDQGMLSRIWKAVKKRYSRNAAWRPLIIMVFGSYFSIKFLIADIFILRRNPLFRYRQYKKSRGMSYFTDMLDWLGGYPFEVAKPEDILDFFRARGFELMKLKTVGGKLGCNEFVFVKCTESVPQ